MKLPAHALEQLDYYTLEAVFGCDYITLVWKSRPVKTPHLWGFIVAEEMHTPPPTKIKISWSKDDSETISRSPDATTLLTQLERWADLSGRNQNQHES